MNETEFSIIIPLYNQEKYIKKSAESALNQTFKGNWEVIIVNDGSTDKSEEILNELKDEKLRIFKNQNGGLAYSRNFGNKKAVGKYIVYLDADDILDKDALKNFYETNKNKDADIILAPYYATREDKDTVKLCFPLKKYENFEGYLNIKNTNGEIFNANFEAWGKAYKRDFILNKNIQSPIIYLAEDLPLFYKAFINTEKILLCNKPVYFYKRDHKRFYTKGRYDWANEVINAIKAADDTIKQYSAFKDVEKIYTKNCLKVCLFWSKKFKKLENKEEFYKFCRVFLGHWGLSGEYLIRRFISNLIDI